MGHQPPNVARVYNAANHTQRMKLGVDSRIRAHQQRSGRSHALSRSNLRPEGARQTVVRESLTNPSKTSVNFANIRSTQLEIDQRERTA